MDLNKTDTAVLQVYGVKWDLVKIRDVRQDWDPAGCNNNVTWWRVFAFMRASGQI